MLKSGLIWRLKRRKMLYMWCPDLSLLPETRSTRGDSVSKSQLTGRGSSSTLDRGKNPTLGGEPRDGSRSPNELTAVARWLLPRGDLSCAVSEEIPSSPPSGDLGATKRPATVRLAVGCYAVRRSNPPLQRTSLVRVVHTPILGVSSVFLPAGENKMILALWVPDSTSQTADHLAKRGSGTPGRGHSNRPLGTRGRLLDPGRGLD